MDLKEHISFDVLSISVNIFLIYSPSLTIGLLVKLGRQLFFKNCRIIKKYVSLLVQREVCQANFLEPPEHGSFEHCID